MYFFMNILIHISSSLLINQFLTLVILFKEREALLIHYVGFFIPFFTNYQGWGCQNYIFIMENNFNSQSHNVEQNWRIFFRITWKGEWKLIIECLYFLLFLWNQYIAGSYCIKIKYIFTIIKGSFFSPLMKINSNLG